MSVHLNSGSCRALETRGYLHSARDHGLLGTGHYNWYAAKFDRTHITNLIYIASWPQTMDLQFDCHSKANTTPG